MFEEVDSASLRGLSVWLPMMSGDDPESARAASESYADDRVEHRWDPERRLGALFAKRLGLQGVAWDVYLLYPAGVVWEDDGPPEPTFWMHQLPMAAGADKARLLHPESLYHAVANALGSGATPRKDDLALRLHLKGLQTIGSKHELRKRFPGPAPE